MECGSFHRIPCLPPKGGRNRPLPPEPRDVQQQHLEGDMPVSRSAPSHTPASFLNPLYYHINTKEKVKSQRSSSIGEASLHFVGSHKVPANPVVKFSDSDSDSVYSLESVHSLKSDRYVEGPLVTMRQEHADQHEYELCEIDRPKVKDIFDLVSFKSPLYGSIRREDVSETYDVPSKDDANGCNLVLEGHPAAEQSSGSTVPDVYDVPIRNSIYPSNEQIDDSTYDIPASAILGFDAEILCDIDGMLPPPYPPPPPPLEVQEVIVGPKVPPRPLVPPPIPKRPHFVQSQSSAMHQSPERSWPEVSTSECLSPFLVPKCPEVLDSQDIFTWIGTPLTDGAKNSQKVIGQSQDSGSAIKTSLLPTKVPRSDAVMVPKRAVEPRTRNVIVQETSSPEFPNESRFSKHSFTSLPRFKKLAKTLSELSLRRSSDSLSLADVVNSSSCPESDVGVVGDERPVRTGVLTCGYLFKIAKDGKETTKKWYSLENSYLCWYPDHKAECPQGRISRRSIAGISTVLNTSTSGCETMGVEHWCLRVFTVNSHHLLLGARLPSECKEWSHQLAALTAPPGIMAGLDPAVDLHFAGQVHVKEGVSGKWQKGYLALADRWIHLWLPDISTLRKINLQTVTAVEKESSLLQCGSAVERGPVFHLNLHQGVLYVQGDWALYTDCLLQWLRRQWTLPPRARLDQHYLTQDGLPVIVDKCLKFVSTHGTTLEGIYRLSGSSSKVRQLLENFMQDVWQVHLKTDDYSPHDVGSTLKRFLRSLPQCLLTEKLYPLWLQISSVDDQVERLSQIRDLLSHLPLVNYNTLKKLIGHLCMITEHSKWNLMPAMNLAPVFGPTLLFQCPGGLDQEVLESTTAATDTVADLISFYSTLFQVDDRELEKERSIQDAVQKMKDSKIVQKPAGDILVGVYIYSKDWGKCINVRLTPTTTAREVCEYALSAGNIMEPLTKIALMEVVCDGSLERPLHYSEFALEVTLRWMSWSQEDARDNYFCIKHNHIHDAILPVVSSLQGQAFSVFGELSYADTSAKNFKKLRFEFTSAKLRCYKTAKNVSQVAGEWNIEDIAWYLGAETKRPPSSKWSFTFIDRNVPVKRSKSNPYFGRTISCRSEDELHKWVAAMLVGEYPQGLVPAICLPDLLV